MRILYRGSLREVAVTFEFKTYQCPIYPCSFDGALMFYYNTNVKNGCINASAGS